MPVSYYDLEPHKQEKFLTKVLDNIKIDVNTGCWEWLGYKSSQYGQIWFDYKRFSIHRSVYEFYNGRIPDDKIVMHICDNPGCCNPDHLTIGTQAENIADMVNKDRHPRGIRHGRAKLTDDNVITIKSLLTIGLSCKEIARMYNVSHTAIYLIDAGKTWKHIN